MSKSVSKPILIGFALISMLSCTKNGQPSPLNQGANNCKIQTAYTIYDGDTTGKYDYTYNSDGTLSGSAFSGSSSFTVSYSYNGNMIYRAMNAGVNSSVDTITLNASGLMLSDKEVTSQGVLNTICTYDANNELQTYSQQTDTMPAVVTTYTFMLGDAIAINGIIQQSITYDIDRPAVTGNLEQFNQLLNLGVMYSKSRHLPTLIQITGNPDLNIAYVYTTEDNISSVTESDGTHTTTIAYSYDCQ